MRIKAFKDAKGPMSVGNKFTLYKKQYTVVRYELDANNVPLMRATDGKKDFFFYEDDLNVEPEA